MPSCLRRGASSEDGEGALGEELSRRPHEKGAAQTNPPPGVPLLRLVSSDEATKSLVISGVQAPSSGRRRPCRLGPRCEFTQESRNPEGALDGGFSPVSPSPLVPAAGGGVVSTDQGVGALGRCVTPDGHPVLPGSPSQSVAVLDAPPRRGRSLQRLGHPGQLVFKPRQTARGGSLLLRVIFPEAAEAGAGAVQESQRAVQLTVEDSRATLAAPKERAARAPPARTAPDYGTGAKRLPCRAAPLTGTSRPEALSAAPSAAMKRQLRREPACISRGRLLSLLPLLFHLPGASPASPAPSERISPLSLRKPWTRSHPPAWLQKRPMTEELSDKTARMWPAWKPHVVAPGSRLHLSVLPRCRLDPQQPGSHPLYRLLWTPALRPKRHAAPHPHRAQLMRVGCALGTCQVQNLNHRLWLLKGQLGRQESAPMNPSSPHSYG
ncbi:protein ADM2 [Lacerta agilis]|uniref:protein ADM2 n=1 Tax=Lacerta agilis TaxID=80427 RepID=UPI00141A46A6|nr:protein ADM2 [Lacerta agilis]